MNQSLKETLLLLDRSTALAVTGQFVKAHTVLNKVLESMPEGFSPPEFPGLYYYIEGRVVLLEALCESAK